jgi:hypothetical protein
VACEGNARDLGHNSLIVIDIYNYYVVRMSVRTTAARTVKRERGPGSVIADIGVRDPWRHRLCSSPPCAWMTGTRSWRQETPEEIRNRSFLPEAFPVKPSGYGDNCSRCLLRSALIQTNEGRSRLEGASSSARFVYKIKPPRWRALLR